MSTSNHDDRESIDAQDWEVRSFVYTFIVDHERPPSFADAAAALDLAPERAELAFQRLHRHHALFLDPGTATIRMAHPFSAIPTAFRVRANGRAYWANCAWDMLGIPAALHADAEIDAHCADTQNTPISLTVTQNRIYGHGEVVHFPLPFQRWYDDLIFT